MARRFGEAIFPVDVLTTFSDGSKKTERWDGVERRVIYRCRQRSAGAFGGVSIRNHVLMLDANYTNRQPHAAVACRRREA